MRVFVTGATGFVGLAVVQELIEAGHEVLGLARPETSTDALIAAGAQVHHGSLEDLDGLRKGAEMTDGVIHTAFNHDFSKFAANCELDRCAIEALGSALEGSNRPLVVTSGTGLLAPGRLATEEDVPLTGPSSYPRVSEPTGLAFAARGVRASVVRLPQVHNRDKQGFVTYAIAIARQKGVSAYIGDGLNRWPAVHRLDAARLYRLAMENAPAGGVYHAVTEEGVSMREIAEAIGRGLKVPVVSKTPEEATEHFGFLGFFVGVDCPASSKLTQERLDWQPAHHPGLMEDLQHATDFQI